MLFMKVKSHTHTLQIQRVIRNHFASMYTHNTKHGMAHVPTPYHEEQQHTPGIPYYVPLHITCTRTVQALGFTDITVGIDKHLEHGLLHRLTLLCEVEERRELPAVGHPDTRMPQLIEESVCTGLHGRDARRRRVL